MVLAWRVHRLIYRLSGGRVGTRLGAMRVLLLTTTGRRSGRAHDVALNYFEDAGRPVVIASNAGDDRHPAWYLNLRAHPEAEIRVGTRTQPVRARLPEGSERERLWRRLVALDPSYEVYERRTSRPIPVVVLDPADGAPQPA